MVVVNIEKVSEVSGRDGPQWELQVKWPWTNAKYADRTWLDQAAYRDPPVIGIHNVTIERTTTKKNRDGEPHDGSKDWMWSYRIIEFDAPNEEPPERGTNFPTMRVRDMPEEDTESHFPGPPAKDAIQTRIEIGMAFNAAVQFVSSDWWEKGGSTEDVRVMRDRLYHEVILVPIAAPHHCYLHEEPRAQGKGGGWGHRDGEGWCLEDAESPVQPSPEPEEPEPHTVFGDGLPS